MTVQSLDRALLDDPAVHEFTTRFPLSISGEIEAAVKLGLDFQIICEYVLEPNEVTGTPEMGRRFRFSAWAPADRVKVREALT